FNTTLLLPHLGLSRRTHLDHCNAANQLGQTLLQLLAVVVGGGLLDLRPDLLHPALDIGALSAAIDECGVVLVDRHALGSAELLDLDALELDAEVLRDRLAASENSNILQHRLATIAEARSIHSSNV